MAGDMALRRQPNAAHRVEKYQHGPTQDSMWMGEFKFHWQRPRFRSGKWSTSWIEGGRLSACACKYRVVKGSLQELGNKPASGWYQNISRLLRRWDCQSPWTQRGKGRILLLLCNYVLQDLVALAVIVRRRYGWRFRGDTDPCCQRWPHLKYGA